jgi:hypothetical protein
MCLYVRSNDLGLGTPFNLAEGAALMHLVGRLTGYTPRWFTYFIGDAHIYENHMDMVQEQLKREPLPLPELIISDRVPDFAKPANTSRSGWKNRTIGLRAGRLPAPRAHHRADGRMTRLDLVPGTLCDERMWGRLLPLLGDGFEFHHVPLHKARSRAQMQELIGAHTAPKANLVAFSLGAYLAVEYALANPERVNSLVIIASSARGLQEKEKPPACASSRCWKRTTTPA